MKYFFQVTLDEGEKSNETNKEFNKTVENTNSVVQITRAESFGEEKPQEAENDCSPEEHGWFSELLTEKLAGIPPSSSFVHLEFHDHDESKKVAESEPADLR